MYIFKNLFIYLKIILLQYFLIFNFYPYLNRSYLNKPERSRKKKLIEGISSIIN